MKKIEANGKSLRSLLHNMHYSIHYYQREYMWQRKQIEELIDDLTSEFLIYYTPGDKRFIPGDNLGVVAKYGTYFMGSVVITGGIGNSIIDGQQRLTSLTLLLMYLNNRLKEMHQTHKTIDEMIFSETFGNSCFNLNVNDREKCMLALYHDKPFDITNAGESVCNLYRRYKEIEDFFPTELLPKEESDETLLIFCDWLISNVFFAEIRTETEQDAHKVFVTMNDRGLSLTPTEMLKGFILSEITDDKRREELNNDWKETVLKLKKFGESGKSGDKEDETFFKAWLRSHYAETIRENKAGSENKDFDIIGGPFHKWVRDEKEKLHLSSSDDYVMFVERFKKFADVYLMIREAENTFSEETKYVFYNARVTFTQQILMLLAPICYDDSQEVIKQKINLVARFIDYWIISRVTCYRSMDYSTVKQTVFNKYTKELRQKSIPELKEIIQGFVKDLNYTPEEKIPSFKLNSFTKKYIKHMLARVTGYLEEQTGDVSKYVQYMDGNQKNPFEIEHIITDHYDWFKDEYNDEEDFKMWRNNIGALLLLRKSINASLNDSKYPDKLPKYCAASQGNIYAGSLGKITYENNPQFKRFIAEKKLEFEPYETFGKEEIDKRRKLFSKLVREIWNENIE